MSRKIAICFGQFGPYMHARVVALQSVAGPATTIVPVQIAAETSTYGWQNDGVAQCFGLHTLCEGTLERSSPLKVFFRSRQVFRREKIDLAFLPSYWPASRLALFASAKSLRMSTVMMSDSHAGTARALGWKKAIKRMIVKKFDAALVAGQPQQRYFASLGLPADKIFTGYDAIDNGYFAERSASCCSDKSERLRFAYSLPERYFLSLGRMVEKKNLATLIEAYSFYAEHSASAGNVPVALVLVGSGDQTEMLGDQARHLNLGVIDHTDLAPDFRIECTCSNDPEPLRVRSRLQNKAGSTAGTVLFYGFRQISESPIFYSLAEAFVLPSINEEWGLVVNEAMACSLPVIVSQNAGCAEDLVPLPKVPDGGRSLGDVDPNTDPTGLASRPNGFIFDPTSSAALANALVAIADLGSLATDRASLDDDPLIAMGNHSRDIVAKFDCCNFARQAMRAAYAARGS